MWRRKPDSVWSRYASEMDKAFRSRFMNMRTRCNNHKRAQWMNYWWRWIKCHWNTIKEFYDDMYESFVKHYKEYWKRNTTLDRIDNDWDYCKENCRRATIYEQAHNKTFNKNITIWWVTKCIEERKRILWMSYNWFINRLKKLRNWEISEDEFFNKEWSVCWANINIDWKLYTITELSKISWYSRPTVRDKYKKMINWNITKDEFKKILWL